MSVTSNEWKMLEPLLHLALTQTDVQAAFVYRFDREQPIARLSAFVGPIDESRSLELRGASVPFHQTRRTPIVLSEGVAANGRFADFPEFRTGRFHGVISVPLVTPEGVVGVANFCRATTAAIRAKDHAFLIALGAPLAALSITESLREELHRTAQQLADRKQLERAKGLLQEALGWTEDEAYRHVRRLSRQQRTPMREIARALIQARTEASA